MTYVGRLSFGRIKVLFLVAVAVAACGCGSNGYDGKYAVNGKVTIDGEPLADGRIKFVCRAEGGSLASAKIVNGEYHIPAEFGAKVGEQLVKIEAYRKSKSSVQPAGYLSDEQVAKGAVEQYLLPKYNTQSELKVEITPDGANNHDFALEAAN